MRKDVKFGLTIGAILVITLVVYVIVLSRGGSPSQRIALITNNPSDQPNASGSADSNDAADSGTDSHLKTQTDEYKPDMSSDSDQDATPGTIPAPGAASNNSPATQPAAPMASTAQPNTDTDWQGALDHGVSASMGAPQRTATPTIDPPAPGMTTGGIARSANTPMIDSLPSTQPSRPLMADVPTLDAPAENPTDSAVNAPLPPPPGSDKAMDDAAAPTLRTPSSPAPMATENANASRPRTHRVAAGESPYSISEEVYGNGKYFKKIMAANPGVNPKRLKIGTLLVIPELSGVETSTDSAATSDASAPIDGRSQYKVVSGDSLESISRKLYGSADMIDKIYQTNKKLIGPDENILKVGWVLKLPAAPTESGAQR